MTFGLFLLISTFGVIVVTSVWGYGLAGKIILIIAGVYLIGASAVKSYFKVTSKKQYKKLTEAAGHYKEFHLELDKIMTKKKSQNIHWLFWNYLKASEKENENDKK
jgi:hypothetical protein